MTHAFAYVLEPLESRRLLAAALAMSSHDAHLAHLAHVAHVQHVAHVAHVEHLAHVEHVEHIEHLAHVQHVAHLEHVAHVAHVAHVQQVQAREARARLDAANAAAVTDSFIAAEELASQAQFNSPTTVPSSPPVDTLLNGLTSSDISGDLLASSSIGGGAGGLGADVSSLFGDLPILG